MAYMACTTAELETLSLRTFFNLFSTWPHLKTTLEAAVLLYAVQYICYLSCPSKASNYLSAEEQNSQCSTELSFHSVLPQPSAKATQAAVRH